MARPPPASRWPSARASPRRADHPHVIGGGSLHARRHPGLPAPQVPRADHHRRLDSMILDGLDQPRYAADLLWVDPEAALAGQRLAAQLQDDAVVDRLATDGFAQNPPSPCFRSAGKIKGIREALIP